VKQTLKRIGAATRVSPATVCSLNGSAPKLVAA
jgi:hypothetical protein